MATNKASKSSKTDKKKGLSTKKALKPLKTKGISKISKANADKPKKSIKRKANISKPKRAQTQYDIVRGIVADYCKRNYGRRCTRAESKEIYQALKLRFLDKESGVKQISIEDIKKDIDKVLAFKGETSPPTSVVLPMPYYDVVTRLYNNDGGFFQDDDTLIFDLSTIGEGKVKTPYAELPYAYKTDIYERVRDYISDVEATGIKVSPPPEFVYDADKSKEDKRIFVWNINFDNVSDKEELFTSEEIKEQSDEKERNEEVVIEKIEEITKGGADADILLIEKEKTKQKEVELEITKEKTKQDAMALLQAGKIDLDTFLKIIG
jgi:hypothetical protein